MAKNEEFSKICNDIKIGKFAPIYLLHGEEVYFVDRILKLLQESVLTDEEKDFDFQQFHGSDVEDLTEVIYACRRYPMVAARQLVILNNAQSLVSRSERTRIDHMLPYFQSPFEQTVLVVVYNGTKLEKADIIKAVAKSGGVVYEGKRVPDYELVKFLPEFLAQTGLQFEPNAIQMLADHIGSDLNRLMSEIEKMRISMTGTRVTADLIAAHIGISKDFNNYELIHAIAVKDFRKCELIRRYFVQNPKNNPCVITLSVLFDFFTNLMLSHYASDKSVNGLMREVGMNYGAAKDMVAALKNYSAWKAMENIALIRECDARQKGARGAAVPEDEVLLDLLYRLMH